MTNVPNELVDSVEDRLKAMLQEVKSIQQGLPPHQSDSDVSELLALQWALADVEYQLGEALGEIGATWKGEYSN